MADGPSAARRKVSTGLAAIALCGLLTSCAAFKQKDVLNEDGLNTKNPVTGSFAGFKTRYDRLQLASKADTVTVTAADAKALVKTGTNIAYQLCSSFFKTAGLEQQQLLFSRDVVGLVGTVVTGVLGATNAGAAATGWLGLGSAAALSGVSIYSRNFLFSEDNVQAVQNLVLTAMDSATKEALRRDDYDFDTAVTMIMDVQSVCEVQHILALVRQSINAGQPTATSSDSGRINVNVVAVTLKDAGASIKANAARVRTVQSRIKALTKPQVLTMAKLMTPLAKASASPGMVALLQQYPNDEWQATESGARGFLLRFLNMDPGSPEQWENAVEAAEKTPK